MLTKTVQATSLIFNTGTFPYTTRRAFIFGCLFRFLFVELLPDKVDVGEDLLFLLKERVKILDQLVLGLQLRVNSFDAGV